MPGSGREREYEGNTAAVSGIDSLHDRGRESSSGPDPFGGVVSARRKPQATTGALADYLTAAQLAELLQVSEKSVYRWAVSDPTFPMLKIGGTVRFPRERVLRWLRDHEQGLGRPQMRRPVRSLINPASTQ